MPNENSEDFRTALECVANGNVDAKEFVLLWTTYCHKFDDLVDGDTAPSAENLVECNNVLLRICNSRFFTQHYAALSVVILLTAETYAACERLKKSESTYEKEWAEMFRHCGNDVLRAVALLTGGEKHLNYVSNLLREFAVEDSEKVEK